MAHQIGDAERASIRERFEERGGTLNGVLALVCGRLEPFATVIAIDGSTRAEFSWPTLRRLIAQNRFTLKT